MRSPGDGGGTGHRSPWYDLAGARPSQQWADGRHCARLHSALKQFGERQKELSESRCGMKEGKGPDHPRPLAGMLVTVTGTGTRGEMGSRGRRKSSCHSPCEEAMLNTPGRPTQVTAGHGAHFPHYGGVGRYCDKGSPPHLPAPTPSLVESGLSPAAPSSSLPSWALA